MLALADFEVVRRDRQIVCPVERARSSPTS